MPILLGCIIVLALSSVASAIISALFSKSKDGGKRFRRTCLSVIFACIFAVVIAAIANGNKASLPEVAFMAALPYLLTWYRIRRRNKIPTKAKARVALPTAGPGAIYTLDGVNDILEVYEHKVAITAKTDATSVLVRGMKGSKSIPYTSITAVQFRKANPMNGYIQFSILGGKESSRGIMEAILDENTCFFVDQQNEMASTIRNFVEGKITKTNEKQEAQASGLGTQLEHLSQLAKNGVLSDEEYAAAKKALIAQVG